MLPVSAKYMDNPLRNIWIIKYVVQKPQLSQPFSVRPIITWVYERIIWGFPYYDIAKWKITIVKHAKQPHSELENHHVEWVYQRFLWRFSTAFLVGGFKPSENY